MEQDNPIIRLQPSNAAFTGFVTTCRGSLNPNLSEAAVEEMLVQHLLTERILRKIFDIENFRERNVIAADIEKVIATISDRHFRRDDFLRALDPFYLAVETAAETFTDFTEKQKFLNIVYERFFQGFAVKQADVLGVVHTPQPLVQFMIASVAHVLREHFGTSLDAKGVHILDPFTAKHRIANRGEGRPFLCPSTRGVRGRCEHAACPQASHATIVK